MDDTQTTAFVETREALHAVADWVLAPLRFAHDGHIGLRAMPGGFGHDLSRVDGCDLVRGEARTRLTTLADAVAFVGVAGGRHSGTYEPETPWTGDAPLACDHVAAAMLSEWFAHGTTLLEAVLAELAADDGARITLWPEHFDVACTVGPVGRQANLGASPGDAGHPLPYLYVGPWNAVDPGDGSYWNEPFGASLTYDVALDHGTALAFFREGLARR